MTEDTFSKGLAFLKEAFPSKAINARIYFEALKDLTDDEFLEAVKGIVLGLPKLYPDDNLIAMIRDRISGTVKDQAYLAWSELRGAIISVGAYKTVSFRNCVINGVVDAMGGWEKVCEMKVEEEPFRQKDFIGLYEAISNTGRSCPDVLVGIEGRVNGESREVVMIGAESIKKIKQIAV